MLLGYKSEEIPSLLPYVPLCHDQPLLSGAAEDLLDGGMQIGQLPACLASLALMDGIPDGLLTNNPYPSRAHPSSSSAIQVGWAGYGRGEARAFDTE